MLKLAGGSWEEEFHFTFKKLGLPENIIGRTVRFSYEYESRCNFFGSAGRGNNQDTFDGIVHGFRLGSQGILFLFVVRTDNEESVTLTYGVEHYARFGWCMEGFRWSEGRGTTDDPEISVENFSGRVEVLPD